MRHSSCVRLVALSVLWLASSAGLLAQTQVGGPILSDTTWSLASSPYQVTVPLIVGNNATLTIEPGVVVELEGGKVLNVGSPSFGDGTLIARGTPASPIRFTTGTGVAGDWDRLLFVDEAVDANVVNENYVSGSILEHCIIELGGGNGVPGAVSLVSSAPFVRACTFRDNLTTGLHADLATGATAATPPLRVHDSAFDRNTGGRAGGIFLLNGSGHFVLNSTFEGNVGRVGGGIFISTADPTLWSLIADNVFANNDGGGVGGGVNAATPQINILRNEFRDNTAGSGGAVVVGSGTYVITDNLIVGNLARGDGGGIYLAKNQFSQYVLINDNTIANNTATRNGGGLWDDRQSNKGPSTATLARNSIAHNVAGGQGGGIYWKASTLRSSGDTITNNRAGADGGGVFNWATASFTATTIADNTAGIAGGGIYTMNAATAIAGDPANSVFNSFLGNTAPQGDAIFNRATFSATGGGDIDASFVCWGPNDPNTNANRIWDFFDDPTRGIVVATNQVPGEPFADLGTGLAGVAGTPLLTGSGPMVGGSALAISLQSAAPQAPTALLIDVGAPFVYVPLLGGIIVPLAAPVAVALVTDAGGNAALLVPALPAGPAGVRIYFQAVVADASAANGVVAVSNALVAITQ